MGCGQDAAGVFELLDDDEDDVVVDEDVDELAGEDDEDVDEESLVDVLVEASFFVDSLPPDFSALTLPERESFR
ncbi:hypothetical protein Aab01nite_24460 [Paractinoplanes abujensis]|uniref:Uncharacterized protein n=1 Tax=Paractinoplanes abujensis TaxID=882441 RepID=A0A7W7D018_9ACTN|nr:hypothetical protein [Actinoplanes abujensis]MBB4696680.1 hypothetical protein [Actinoplanes abujensis]GID18856.1 hypothetical protein Aab01nite_24460 [Actinoplanes abujensis]